MLIFNVVGNSFNHELIIDAIMRYIGYFFGDGVDVVLAELAPLLALCDCLIYTAKEALDSFLIIIQHLYLLFCDLFFQVFKGHLDLDSIGIQDIIQHTLTVNEPLPLEATLGNSLLQPFLRLEEDVLDLAVSLTEGQDLVTRVFACQIIIDRETSIKTVHTDHAATVLPVRRSCLVPQRTNDFVGQSYRYLRDVTAGTAFNIELVKQSFMLFLLSKQRLDAGGADGVAAVESERGEEELIACGASVLAASHLNIIQVRIVWNHSSRIDEIILMYMLVISIIYSLIIQYNPFEKNITIDKNTQLRLNKNPEQAMSISLKQPYICLILEYKKRLA